MNILKKRKERYTFNLWLESIQLAINGKFERQGSDILCGSMIHPYIKLHVFKPLVPKIRLQFPCN